MDAHDEGSFLQVIGIRPTVNAPQFRFSDSHDARVRDNEQGPGSLVRSRVAEAKGEGAAQEYAGGPGCEDGEALPG
jgi:hypothetical protein